MIRPALRSFDAPPLVYTCKDKLVDGVVDACCEANCEKKQDVQRRPLETLLAIHDGIMHDGRIDRNGAFRHGMREPLHQYAAQAMSQENPMFQLRT